MSRILSLSLAIFIFSLSVPTAQAISLNPLSIIKGAVEAAVEDRSSNDIAVVKDIKNVVSVKTLVKVVVK